jgi:hypothetical protein
MAKATSNTEAEPVGVGLEPLRNTRLYLIVGMAQLTNGRGLMQPS